jgi:hypothetical protein
MVSLQAPASPSRWAEPGRRPATPAAAQCRQRSGAPRPRQRLRPGRDLHIHAVDEREHLAARVVKAVAAAHFVDRGRGQHET